MNTEQVFKQAKTYLRRYTRLDEQATSIGAAYAMATWISPEYNTVKYLQVLGEGGSGKSTLLHMLGSICLNPVFCKGGMSPNALLSMLNSAAHKEGATFCIDESEPSLKLYTEDGLTTFGAILVSGADQATRYLLRMERDHNQNTTPIPYDTFGPKILVRSTPITDPAIASRCITVTLKSTGKVLQVMDAMINLDADMQKTISAIFEWRLDTKKYPNTFMGLFQHLLDMG
jgi:energy-coupling factor transporter ATP-binding protein EcfA2